LFLEKDLDGRVARLPSGTDPDDFVRAHGKEGFDKVLADARPMVERFIDDLVCEADGTIPGRVRALETATPVLASVRNATARELYAERLAIALELKASQVHRAVRAVQVPDAPAPVAEVPRRTPPKEQLEALALLITYPELAKTEEAEQVLGRLSDPGVLQMYRAAWETLRRDERMDVPAWLDAGPADIRNAVGLTLMDGRAEGGGGAERALRALGARLALSSVSSQIEQTKREHLAALTRGDEAGARALALAEIELIRTREGLSRTLAHS
jgi:DNA primase